MADLKARLKPIFRRSSTLSSASASSSIGDTLRGPRSQCKSSLRLSTSRKTFLPISVFEEYEPSTPLAPFTPTEEYRSKGDRKEPSDTSPETPRSPALETRNPILVVEAPTPEIGVLSQEPVAEESRPDIAHQRHLLAQDDQSRPTSSALLIESPALQPAKTDYFGGFTVSAGMLQKKIWVKRPGSSATQVTISGEDLVDDVRDMILKKYANSLGRSCDPPDITLRLAYRKQSARHSNCERTLGPEEPLLKLLDLHYPGGQSVEEALVIDIPQRRTPKHSPRMAMPYYLHDDTRPHEDGTDYFPPMPQAGQHSPHLPSNVSVSSAKGSSHHPPSHSMAVLTTAHLPNLPSPGSRMPRHSQHRQKYGRQHTTSPTVLQGPPNALNYDNLKNANPSPVPTPPIPEEMPPHKAVTPPAHISSPRPKPNVKRSKKQMDQAPQPLGLLDGAVPPINVLIVEDNIINLRLLEAFMKRLKVRWSTAMNGRDAVTKWRDGGYHLVLMDIQLPVMNGLDATKEIRRLERVNSIGVFTNSTSSTPTFANGDGLNGVVGPEDSLMNTALFKSPVIIVALTASSLQSDRHEALAAGCNDFLTKPVNFEWLTRKVMEWGCMQALIDFDGWRKWKHFSQTKPAEDNKKAVNGNLNNKSPKAALNGKAQNTPKRDRMMSLGLGKEKAGSDGTDSHGDSGSGETIMKV